MRVVWISFVVLALFTTAPGARVAGKEAQRSVVLANVSHAIDGRTLVISGFVENGGPEPVARLVIDARGFSPSGDLTAFGSDGIPWEIRPGGTERFTIALPIDTQLIRDYLVQVSFVDPNSRPLAGVRRGVAVELYRPLLLSMVRVQGDMLGSQLTVRSNTAGLPITQVTVEATLLLQDLRNDHAKIFTIDLDIPAAGTAVIPFGLRRTTVLLLDPFIGRTNFLTVPVDILTDGTVVVPLGIRFLTLLNLRVIDVRLKTTWAE